MKNLKFIRLNNWFAIFVVLPTLIAALYYGLVASDQYVSESRFVVKGRSGRSDQLSGLASLVQVGGLSSGQEQTNEVIDYIRSRNALMELQRRVDIQAKFKLSGIDPFSRYPSFWKKDRFENFYRYYLSKIGTKVDSETGLAVLTVRAFTPADTRQINSVLLDLSEGLVNRLNGRARDKAIAEAEQRVASAQERVRKARLAMGQYRNSQELIDPLKQAGGVLAISDQLISAQAALQTQLELMVRATPRNPSIPALRGRIAAIGSAIAHQNSRAVGTPSALSSKMSGYDNLALEQEFASQNLTAASASLEQARAEAQRQQYYLERVVEPQEPDISRYPQRLWSILTVAGVALCLYLVGWMLIVGIIEHSPDN
ncbi:capsule biosynthesis protein [Sphingomonas sp. MMS24-J13]|uniref:capsule biosynthesis protein n=1 Tax=Sphingomonas sp. MMS24-J13 TaxID=3238686 RepID=UPI003850256F